jgi:hypothetical protein
MKSRNLFTIHNLIASNCTITQIAPGKYLHTFTPATTSTVYEFEANATDVITEGEHYNIGFYIENNRNVVELSALSPISKVNPLISLLAAKQTSLGLFETEKAKNNQRVTHSATDGYYWGKKYAWRAFGLVIPKDAFYQYLEEIKHPSIPCITNDPELSYPDSPSIAYKEDGLTDAVEQLILTACVKGAYFKSPLYSKKFSIRGIPAITDKK